MTAHNFAVNVVNRESKGGSMKCDKCGGEIPENSGFCHLCGAKLEVSACENNNAVIDNEVSQGSWFRRFVLWFIDSWIEGVSLILFIILIYCSWQMIQDEYMRGWGICLLCIGTLVLFLISWLFFCVIETRDLLKRIAKNTSIDKK